VAGVNFSFYPHNIVFLLYSSASCASPPVRRTEKKLRRRCRPARRHYCPPTFRAIVDDAAARPRDIAGGFGSFLCTLTAAVPPPSTKLR
jgi:hypothetical protein